MSLGNQTFGRLSLGVANYPSSIVTSDTLSVLLYEISALPTLFHPMAVDSINIGIYDSSYLKSKLLQTDTISLEIVESSSTLLSRLSRSDNIDVRILESLSMMGTVSSTDIFPISLGENDRVILVKFNNSDNIDLSLSELYNLKSILTRQDTLSLTITESPSSISGRVVTNDIIAINLDELPSIFGTFHITDDIDIDISDHYDYDGFKTLIIPYDVKQAKIVPIVYAAQIRKINQMIAAMRKK